MSGPALGVELADHGVRAVVVEESGRVRWRSEKRPADARALATLVKAAMKGAGGRLAAAGVAGYDPIPPAIADAVAAAAGVPAHQTYAGLAAVIAESWCGAAQNQTHVVALTLGERVAAGAIVGGVLLSGAHGLAGSASWLAINPVERQDYRKFGSLDAEVSARGIARRLVWRLQAGDRSTVLQKAGALDAITADHVFEGARRRDGVAVSVVRDTAKYIGMAVANLVATLDPEIAVLGGALADAGDLLLEPVRQECARRLSPSLLDNFRLEMSPLRADAIAIGAARLAAPEYADARG
jgi:glucokinase